MGYVKKDVKGNYVQAKDGTILHVRNIPAFKPIDYSQPKQTRPGLATADPANPKTTKLT